MRPSTRKALAVALAAVLLGAACHYTPTDSWSPGAIDARVQINDLLYQADLAEEGGDGEAAQQLRAEAAAIECEHFGCKQPAGDTQISFDPTLSGGFFSAPWPSDTRLAGDGSIDMAGFPGRAGSPIADLVIGAGEGITFGFGTNSAVYFQADAPIDATSLPRAAEESVQRRGTAMLLNLDDPSAAPVPLLVDVADTATELRPANLVALLPYPGHPLEPATRYAAVLFDEVRDIDGDRLASSPLLAQLDGPAPGGVDGATWAQLRSHRDEALEAVRQRTLWHPSEVLALTVFTTQSPTDEMAAVAAAVADLPQPEPLEVSLDPGSCSGAALTAHGSGRLALPVWQQGERPFLTAGGGIVVDGTGRAVQNGVETGSDGQGVVVDLAIPCGPAPAAGWPVLIFMDGTGGSAQAGWISELGADLPFAVISIAPMYSSDRLTVAPPPFDDPGFQFFNYLNPLAARTNLVQQAADVLYLQRLAGGLDLESTEVDARLDAGTVVMAGHSQGATSLPLTLAFASDVAGAFLSASGGGLYHSIVHREDVRTLVDGILGTQPGELDMFHPYPQLLQTFAEGGDATNYASMIDTDIVLYGGLRDGCTAIEVSTQLAQALGVPVARPQARRPLFGDPFLSTVAGYESPFEPFVVETPVSQNLPGGRTGVVVQVDAGHFGASTYPDIGRSFVTSIAEGGPAVVNPGPTPPVAPGSSCPRYGPAPGA